MDIVKITFNESHNSDKVDFIIQPLKVEPKPPITGISLLPLLGLALIILAAAAKKRRER